MNSMSAEAHASIPQAKKRVYTPFKAGYHTMSRAYDGRKTRTLFTFQTPMVSQRQLFDEYKKGTTTAIVQILVLIAATARQNVRCIDSIREKRWCDK